MAGTTPPRKTRATSTTPRKPRRTKAEMEAARAAAERTNVAPGLDFQADLPDVDGGAIDLGVSTKANGRPAQRDRVVLFRYDGIGYSIPAKFGLLDTLSFADIGRREGPDAAVAWCLNMALGTVGWQKLLSLREDPDVGDVKVQRLVDIVVGRVIGVDDPKG